MGDPFKDHCNKTVDIYVDVASPEVTNQNRGQPLTCWYRFRSFRGAPRDWVLRLRFNKFKVGNLLNATHCEGGYLQVSIIVTRGHWETNEFVGDPIEWKNVAIRHGFNNTLFHCLSNIKRGRKGAGC